jgi:VanZ family protein
MTALVWRAALIVLTLAITLLSLVPPALRPTTAVSHQTEHLLIFALTGVAIALGFRWRWQAQVGALALFAAAIETAQLFVPGRHARLSDLVINILGAAIGVGMAHLARRVSSPEPRRGEMPAPDQAPR